MSTTLLDCGHEESAHSAITSGYGLDAAGKKFCYACCAEQDKKHMRTIGRITLYLHNKEVTNWPGSLRFPVAYSKTSRHNMAGTRTDVWFNFEGTRWHGYQIGNFTEVCHCRQIKGT